MMKRVLGITTLLLLFVLGMITVLRIDWATWLSTDLRDALPEQIEDDPALSELLQQHRSQIERLAFWVLPEDVSSSRRIQLVTALQDLDAVAEAGDASHLVKSEEALSALLKHRFTLLFPTWLTSQRVTFAEVGATQPFPAWLAEQAVARLDQRLSEPDSLVAAELAPRDPLLLLDSLARDTPALPADDRLVWVVLHESPFEEGVAREVALVLTEVVAASFPDDAQEVATAGAVFAAKDSEEAIRAEVTRLNLLSLALVLPLVGLLARRWILLLHIALILLAAYLSGLLVLRMVFDEIQVFPLILGALLAGIAVDCGFHVLVRGRGEPPPMRALLLATGSSMVGFGAFVVSDLPAVQQAGVLLVGGLAGAWFFVTLYAPQVAPVEPRSRLLPSLPVPWSRRLGAIMTVAVLTLGVMALARLSWSDDIRHLQPRLPAIEQAQARLMSEGNFSAPRAWAVSREPSELFDFLHDHPEALPAAFQLALPALPDIREARAFLNTGEFQESLRASAGRAGYNVEAFAPFFSDATAFVDSSLEESLFQAWRDLTGALRGPVQGLAGVKDDILYGPTQSEASSDVALLPLDHMGSINASIATVRRHTVAAVLPVAAIVTFVVFFTHRKAGGVVVLAPLLAAVAGFSLASALGAEAQFFHVLGALLVFCIGIDYVIFAARHPKATIPPSIHLSAATTLASFGVLATSSIPALAALGATVAIGIAFAWLAAVVSFGSDACAT